MTTFLAQLWRYFGVIGIMSILLWLGSMVMLCGLAWHRKRTRIYGLALGVAVLGALTASLNSHRVNRIRVDQSAEIQAGRERGAAVADEAVVTNAYHDIGGAARGAEDLTEEERAARKVAYRERGKVARDEGKTREEPFDAGEAVPDDTASVYRLMPARDVTRANRFDRINLFLSRLAIWLALGGVVLDYLRRLNRTFDGYFPLPLACGALDTLAPKTLSVALRPGQTDLIRTTLETAVRRGETFLYFGPRDPWAGDTLPRLRVGRHTLWSLRKIRCTGDAAPLSIEDALESAWFNRYCFTVEGPDVGRRWLDALEAFLQRRQAVRAWARRTVYIAWDHDEPIPDDRLQELLFLCRETNGKLMAVLPGDQGARLADLFDERTRV